MISCSKYINQNTVRPPAQLICNTEYVNQVQLKINSDNSNKNDNNNMIDAVSYENNALTPIEKNEEADVERMDETDFAMKNILNSFQLNNHTKVFCCGDKEKLSEKFLLSRKSPGQAVRTAIYSDCGSTTNSVCRERFREGDELKPKKMKITKPENV